MERIEKLLDELANIERPTISEVLAKYGYTYEAYKLGELIEVHKKLTSGDIIAAIN